MAQWQGVCTALRENQSSIPSTRVGSSQLQGDPTPLAFGDTHTPKNL